MLPNDDEINVGDKIIFNELGNEIGFGSDYKQDCAAGCIIIRKEAEANHVRFTYKCININLSSGREWQTLFIDRAEYFDLITEEQPAKSRLAILLS